MKTLISINPANQAVIGEVPVSTKEEINNKVKLAHAIKAHWKALGVDKRVEILRPLIELFKAKENQIASLTTQEVGKPIAESIENLHSDFKYFEHFLSEGPQYIANEMTLQRENVVHQIVYEPRGVVACISPWNFPFANFIWAVIPNLIVGNTVIFKHSEKCPLIGKLIEEVMLSLTALPDGVFSEIYGDSTTGEMLANENIDMIWFTGSSSVGKKLFEIAGKKQIKCILEMGGSNAAILFEDVDIDTIIPRIYEGRFYNCGQVCDAIKRLVVHKNIFKQVIEKLSKYIQTIQVGDPEKSDTQMGPLVSEHQLLFLESQVKDAVTLGATIVTGGKRPTELMGSYYLPTLLININKSMRVWNEEVFGPVLSIMPFETESQAIAISNDTDFGLGATI